MKNSEPGTKKRDYSKAVKVLQSGSAILMLCTAVLCIVYFKHKGLTAQDLKNYAPENLFLAAAAIVLFYVVKSFSLVFPLPILYVAVGLIFPNVWQAFAVNLTGVVLSLSLPFFLGRFAGKDLIVKLTGRFPKIKKLDEIKSDNETVFVFILKLSGVLACDLSSLLLGAMDIRYKKFMFGSIAGLLPLIIAWTFLAGVLDFKSPYFYLAIGGIILVALGSSFVYKKFTAKKSGKIQGEKE